MKILFAWAAWLAVALAAPAPAPAQISAPAGWTAKTPANGARTYTPPDLQAGEHYGVTIYQPVPLSGKSLEAYLRDFAGPVGSKVGQLTAPLTVSATNPQTATGVGAYAGPAGPALGVLFVGFSLDGASVQVTRTLFSSPEVLARYQTANTDLLRALVQEAGNRLGVGSPAPAAAAAAQPPGELPEGMKPGGSLVPGVYAGTQYKFGSYGSQSALRLRVYLYPNDEYRICNEHDEDFDLSGPVVGKFKYNATRGALDVQEYFALTNDRLHPDRTYCFYGRGADGKPLIYGRSSVGATTSNGYTRLVWEGPPTGRAAQSVLEAPAKAAQAKRDLIPTRVAPGQGVPDAQVVAVFHDYSSSHVTLPGVYMGDTFGGYAPGLNIHNQADAAYLLLRDGTVFKNLQLAPDQFDARASRRKEPENWGLWKREAGQYQVSFAGEPYGPLPGRKGRPGTAQTRLSGRYLLPGKSAGAGVTFTAAGRFKRDPAAAGLPDQSAAYTLTQAQRTAPGGDLAGTYSVNGYALTLRYENGKVERMRFFFTDPSQDALWFEGRWLVLDTGK